MIDASTKCVRLDETVEWLETDGLGGFAMGTATGIRTRRYHSLLTASPTPPANRIAMLKGFDAWVETPEGAWGLSTQRYLGDHEAPEGAGYIVSFSARPWPTWEYLLPSGVRIVQELFIKHGSPLLCASWRLIGDAPVVRLTVRPLLSCAPMHAMQRESAGVSLVAAIHSPTCISWRPDSTSPELCAATNGAHTPSPSWYRGLLYLEEQRRGFDHTEDLASPGSLSWDLAREEAALLVSMGRLAGSGLDGPSPPAALLQAARIAELERRNAFPTRLHACADKYIVRRNEGRTIIAGYPWFGDWGRDTFISMRGLCHRRPDEARSILLAWSGLVSEGMLPNRFADAGDEPEFNSVDASLWYIVAAGEHLDHTGGWHDSGCKPIADAIREIVEGYARGTRYGIRTCDDGLLAAGESGVQLTWMDARVDGREVTPRIGKPVEVQALWINALRYAARLNVRWNELLERAQRSFESRFWNPRRRCLFDVVDAGHVGGECDHSIRPNQILAVGGLPYRCLSGERAWDVVRTVERHLLTPLGLRTLAAFEPGYCPRYEGGPEQRDGAYHQGTVWPWLMGPFVEAWLAVHGESADNARVVRSRFIAPLTRHLDDGGIDGVSEILDAEPPRLPRGCPFQAWSVGELLRVTEMLNEIESGGQVGAQAAPLTPASTY